MFFELKEIDRIKGRLQNDDYAKRGYEAIKQEVIDLTPDKITDIENRAEELYQRSLTMGVGKVMRYGNFLRDTSAKMVKIAFVAQMEGLDKTADWLRLAQLVCKDKWQIQGKFDGWESDLWTAGIGANLALSYEVMKENLSEEKQQFIEDSLWEKGFLPIYNEWISPEKHVHAFDTMGHNWWSVCVGGAGVILLVLNNKEGFETYLENIVDSFDEWFKYKGNLLLNKKPNFGEKSDYIETLGYLMYGLSNFMIFNEMLKDYDKYQLDVSDVYKAIPDIFIHNHFYSDGKICFAQFGDNKVTTGNTQLLFKICDEFKRGDFLPLIKDIGEIKTPVELYFFPDTIEQTEIDIQTEAIYENTGCAVVRDGFGKNDMAFFMKGGESWNHNHLDIGSYELVYNGEKFITDSGSCTYSNNLYRDYYITTKAHNTLTFNGKGQLPTNAYNGTKFIATFPCLFKAKGYRYLLADCTGPYTNVFQRFYRQTIFLEDMIVMIDDVMSYQDGQVETYLHGKFDMNVCADHVEIVNKKGSMDVYYPFTELNDIELADGYLCGEPVPDEREEITPESQYIIHEYQTDKCRAKLVTLLVPTCESNNDIKIDEIGTKNVKEIVVTRNGVTERIVINERADGRVMHQNGIIEYEDVETDAAIIYIKQENDGLSIAMHNGSFVKKNGKVYMSSLLKCNAMLDTKSSTCYVNAPNDMKIHVLSGDKIVKYSLDMGDRVIKL